MKAGRIYGRAVSTFGIILLFCACALLLYNIWDTGRAGRSIEEAARNLETYRQEQSENRYTFDDPNSFPQTRLSEQSDPSRPMKEVTINGMTYIGNLQVPSLGLDLPVMTNWSYRNLKIAPCRYTGSVYQDDMVLAAHNYRRHFGPLRDLAVGSEIRFTDMDGNQFRYTIAASEIIQPTEIEKMIVNDYDLTLFTCVPSGKARCAVRCTRIREP